MECLPLLLGFTANLTKHSCWIGMFLTLILSYQSKNKSISSYIVNLVGVVKPLGSITKDFPFLDDNTRHILEFVMHEATNYWDFAYLLSERAVDTNCPPLIVFLSLYHSSRLEISAAIENVMNAHPNLPVPLPFIFGNNDYEDVADTIHRAIELIPNRVIMIYMLMRLYRATSHGSPEEKRTQRMIEDLPGEEKQLRLHSADYHNHMGSRLRYDGQIEKAREQVKQALKLARESDDQWHLVPLLMFIGQIDAQFTNDPNHYSKARKYLGEATTIAESLGYKVGIATILQNMAVYSSSRGEVNEALKCELESAQILEELGNVNPATAYNLAMFYAYVDEGMNAIEWAKISLEQMGGPYAQIALASANLALERYAEVESSLDAAKALAHKGGLEMALGQVYQNTGRLELKRGDLESAMDSFQRALDIHERASRLLRIRTCLRDMAQTELAMFNPTKENQNEEHAGPWMERYEEAVSGKDLPGHLAMLMLLKAELRMTQGRHIEGEQLLDSVSELTDYPSVKFLHQQSIETREKWIDAGVLTPRRPEKS